MADSLQLDYDAAEDRLVLSFFRDRDAAAGEIGAPESPPSLLLTRRVVAAWRPDLRAVAERSAAVSPQLHPAARRVMASAHHEVMAAQVKRASAPPVRPPAGRAALVERVVSGRHKDGRWVLRFESRDGGVHALKLSTALLHAFIALLDRRIAEAGWGLPIMAASSGPTALPPRTMH